MCELLILSAGPSVQNYDSVSHSCLFVLPSRKILCRTQGMKKNITIMSLKKTDWAIWNMLYFVILHSPMWRLHSVVIIAIEWKPLSWFQATEGDNLSHSFEVCLTFQVGCFLGVLFLNRLTLARQMQREKAQKSQTFYWMKPATDSKGVVRNRLSRGNSQMDV